MTDGIIRRYYTLTKPGIIYGNALVAAAGFVYVSGIPFNWFLFLATLAGLSLVIASACVCNNYYDRFIDANMERTKTRALVTGAISASAALWYAAVLGIAGALVLYFLATGTAFSVALFGWIVYVVAYTPLKHESPHALWIGALAGATPPVVGYVAITDSLDWHAFWLFLFLFIWQIPHFLGIAAYRYGEYAEAGVPLLIKKPTPRGKKIGRIVFYASLVVLLLWCGALMLHR